MNTFLKILIGVTCVSILLVFGLNAYVFLVAPSRLTHLRKTQEEESKIQLECAKARALMENYSRGGKQKPGMMSWDDARAFRARNCSKKDDAFTGTPGLGNSRPSRN
jgi:hypothetical protein